MVNLEDKEKLLEEFLFWEAHLFSICILKKIPELIPDNINVMNLLAGFLQDQDYYAIVHRYKMLKQQTAEMVFENN